MVEKLKNDIIQSMKSRNKERLEVLKMVKAAMDLEHIDKKREINDDLLLDIVNKQIKMCRDSITEFEKANRQDLVEKTEQEIAILMEYLPEQLSKEEVMAAIEKIFADINPTSQKDMGKVMKEANASLKGKADMKEVSSIIKEKLQ